MSTRQNVGYYILCFIIIFLVSVFGAAAVCAGDPSGKTYYTMANIWYEHPEKIYSTNYHKGTILPVGTKISVVGFDKEKIRFTVSDSGMIFTYIHVRKHSSITMEELFDRYFSNKNIMAQESIFNNLATAEQKNIKNGTIDVGMSKDAVLMTYGYPPSHKTPTLDSNMWTYWRDRFRRVLVYFENGKIVNIKQ